MTRFFHGLSAILCMLPGVLMLTLPLFFDVNGVLTIIGTFVLLGGFALTRHTNILSLRSVGKWLTWYCVGFGLLYCTNPIWTQNDVGIAWMHGAVAYGMTLLMMSLVFADSYDDRRQIVI